MCIFHNNTQVKCSGSGELNKISKERLTSIAEKSKIRKDNLHVEIETLTLCENLDLACHRNCVSTYTSDTHIQRYIKRNKSLESNILSSPPEKRTRRSETPKFVWKEQCFFCGDPCSVIPDPKHPDRHREAYECHTSQRPNMPTFKDAILKVSVFLLVILQCFMSVL